MSSDAKKAGRPADTAKREAILEAATRAFFGSGFAASSIEQIAADAGVSKVTVYSHFGDKRGLFAAAVEGECERLRDQFQVTPDLRGTLRQRLTAIGETMVGFLSRPEMVQFERRIAAETEHEPDIGAAFLESGPHRMKAAFKGLMQAMVDAGEVRIDDVDLAVEQFASMCKGMGDLERRFGHPGDPERDRQRIDGAVEVFCRAYAIDECERK
ncbi:TetR/AcrR family transcriptional regulator [Qipengyuania sphaerica]|uniref:TetR/AcrR family transcriptional regulator n=1 Tax=Qipengyuania sphaerica TaxID=2867243 RepID=UPI001C886C63|nr:TetR/AcrR family transcriptional regulator [Qipengyuania sphaerica]MBX7539694.1 TetR/AcrR family transcriptional regulator [Qipengyuania sphaerica]